MNIDWDSIHNRLDQMIVSGDGLINNLNLKTDVAEKLLPYQYLHVCNLVTSIIGNNRVIDASDMGTGKTFTAIATAAHLGNDVIVICPKTMIPIWKKVCNLFDVNALAIVNYEQIKKGMMYNTDGSLVIFPYMEPYVIKEYNKQKINKKKEKREQKNRDDINNPNLIVHYFGKNNIINNFEDNDQSSDINNDDISITDEEPTRKYNKYVWNLPKNALIIFDEVHRCKSSTTENGKLLMSLREVKNAKILMMSATIADTPEQFKVFGYMLGLYNSIGACKGWIDALRKEDRKQRGFGSKKSSAMHRMIFPNYGSRMKISEIADQFPKNQISVDTYQLEPEVTEQVNIHFDKLKLQQGILKQKINMNEKTDILSEIQKICIKLESFKLTPIIDLMKNYLNVHYNVVIFLNYKSNIQKMYKKVNGWKDYKTEILTGENTILEREQIVNRFQQNETNILIISSKMGEGISLHDINGRPRVSFLSPSFSANEFRQNLGRIHRAGSLSPAIQRVVMLSGTCEDAICETINKKLRFMNELTDTDLSIQL